MKVLELQQRRRVKVRVSLGMSLLYFDGDCGGWPDKTDADHYGDDGGDGFDKGSPVVIVVSWSCRSSVDYR